MIFRITTIFLIIPLLPLLYFLYIHNSLLALDAKQLIASLATDKLFSKISFYVITPTLAYILSLAFFFIKIRINVLEIIDQYSGQYLLIFSGLIILINIIFSFLFMPYDNSSLTLKLRLTKMVTDGVFLSIINSLMLCIYTTIMAVPYCKIDKFEKSISY